MTRCDVRSPLLFLMYYCKPPALIQTLTHKNIIYYTFTIRVISITSYEHGTVRSWWCTVKYLQITSSFKFEDFAAAIQG